MRVVPPGAARAGLGRPAAAVLRPGVPAARLRAALRHGEGRPAGDVVLVSRAELDGLQDRLYQLRCALEDVQTLLHREADQGRARALAVRPRPLDRPAGPALGHRAQLTADRSRSGRQVLAVTSGSSGSVGRRRRPGPGRCCPAGCPARRCPGRRPRCSRCRRRSCRRSGPSRRPAQAVIVAPPPKSARAVSRAASGRRICMPRPYEHPCGSPVEPRRHLALYVTVTQCRRGWLDGERGNQRGDGPSRAVRR